MYKLLWNGAIILFALYLSSCASSKKPYYFVDLGSGDLNSSNLAPRTSIQSGDILSITVYSLSQQSLNVFNTPNLTDGRATNTSTSNYNYTGPGNVNQLSGYLVGSDGYIKFPMLGRLKVAGLSKNEVEEMITSAIVDRKLLLDPIITVRQLNFRVTVLGEVGRPTTINVPSEKISLLEAIGMAGDLTIYARRDNILVIREENNKKVTKRLNLNSSEIFTSPFYYLQPNDVVYVEPDKAKVESATRGRQMLPVIFSALSFTVVLVDLIINSKR
jgi:polysaccharide export outer membrane protein